MALNLTWGGIVETRSLRAWRSEEGAAEGAKCELAAREDVHMLRWSMWGGGGEGFRRPGRAVSGEQVCPGSAGTGIGAGGAVSEAHKGGGRGLGHLAGCVGEGAARQQIPLLLSLRVEPLISLIYNISNIIFHLSSWPYAPSFDLRCSALWIIFCSPGPLCQY